MTSVHPASDIRILEKECRSLGNAGYDVSFIVPGAQSETRDKVKIIGLPRSKGGRLSRMTLTVMKVFRAAWKEKAYVYHLHDPELLFAGSLLKFLRGRKVIYDVHEDYAKQKLSKDYIPKIIRKPVSFFVKATEKLVSKFYDGIVTATDDILENFSWHKNAASVKNYPLLSLYPSIKEEKTPRDDSLHLVYIGEISEIRGLDQIMTALDTAASHLPLTFSLCGKFYPLSYKEKFESHKSSAIVKYRGWIEPWNIPGILQEADIGLVCLLPRPNFLTSLPVKLFEYMASGLPVIASNFPLWEKIISENKCGICVDPCSPDEIAKAVQTLSKDPGLRAEMGENGKRAVQDKFNWEKESEKLIHLYRKIIHE
jgi:glycosyltransferase involved in cell wall biosynthesis